MKRAALITGLAAAALAGCAAVGPDFHSPPSPVAEGYLAAPPPAQTASTPGEGAQRLVVGGAVEARWWTLFGSPALDALEDEALKANPDLAAAQAALTQAHELLLAQRAQRFPTAQLSLGGSRQKDSGTLSSPLASNAQTYSLYSGQFDVSYVLDLFGGQRRQTEAVAAQVEAQRFQTEAAYLALTSNVASTALQIAGLEAQLVAAEDTVAAYRRMQAITRRMQAEGEASTLDLAAADSALAGAEQALPPLKKQIGQLEDLLAVYRGRPPAEAGTARLHLADLRLPAELPVSLPSDLVRQRPDVRAAEANLHVASAAVGVAVAARLPSFALTGSLGGTSTALQSLVSSGNGLWAFGGSATGSVFDAGALRHQQKAAEAALAQAQAQYRSAVLAALQNTADVLQAIVRDAESLQLAARAVEAAARTSALARVQFEHGETGALPALNAEAALRQAELALAEARAARYADSVALLQALGGGWWNRPQTGEGPRG